MYEEQDREQEGIVGWVIGIAAFIAVAVSLWMGLMGAFQNTTSQGAGQSPTAMVTGSTSGSSSSSSVTPVVGSTETVSIYFDLNKFSPPNDSAARLDGLINYARANINAKVAITGYADKTGDADKNAQLAKDRALAVKNQLISAGMPEDRIMMQKPQMITGDQTDNKEARRVDVYTMQ